LSNIIYLLGGKVRKKTEKHKVPIANVFLTENNIFIYTIDQNFKQPLRFLYFFMDKTIFCAKFAAIAEVKLLQCFLKYNN